MRRAHHLAHCVFQLEFRVRSLRIAFIGIHWSLSKIKGGPALNDSESALARSSQAQNLIMCRAADLHRLPKTPVSGTADCGGSSDPRADPSYAIQNKLNQAFQEVLRFENFFFVKVFLYVKAYIGPTTRALVMPCLFTRLSRQVGADGGPGRACLTWTRSLGHQPRILKTRIWGEI